VVLPSVDPVIRSCGQSESGPRTPLVTGTPCVIEKLDAPPFPGHRSGCFRCLDTSFDTYRLIVSKTRFDARLASIRVRCGFDAFLFTRDDRTDPSADGGAALKRARLHGGESSAHAPPGRVWARSPAPLRGIFFSFFCGSLKLRGCASGGGGARARRRWRVHPRQQWSCPVAPARDEAAGAAPPRAAHTTAPRAGPRGGLGAPPERAPPGAAASSRARPTPAVARRCGRRERARLPWNGRTGTVKPRQHHPYIVGACPHDASCRFAAGRGVACRHTACNN